MALPAGSNGEKQHLLLPQPGGFDCSSGRRVSPGSGEGSRGRPGCEDDEALVICLVEACARAELVRLSTTVVDVFVEEVDADLSGRCRRNPDPTRTTGALVVGICAAAEIPVSSKLTSPAVSGFGARRPWKSCEKLRNAVLVLSSVSLNAPVTVAPEGMTLFVSLTETCPFLMAPLSTALSATSGAFTWAPGPRSSDWTVFVPLKATAVPPLRTRKTAMVAITFA
jgi:hypothetical protein